MTSNALRDTLLLSVATGMRTFSGPATLVSRHAPLLMPIAALVAGAEMTADKLPAMGNRTDAAPLTGRAVMGALIGGVIARRNNNNIVAGAALGAALAVAAAHAAFRLRSLAPGPSALSGVVEDALVVGLCSRYSGARRF